MPQKTKLLILPLIAALLTILNGGCQPINPTLTNDTLLVTVSILPQAYFVERIGGDLVQVNVMVGPGEEAHTYEPTPEQMKSLTASQLFFTIGVEYEQAWLPRFADINPELHFFDSAAGIQRIPMTDDHDHDSDHTDESLLDPHVWLAPANGQQIADNILAALTELAPEHADAFNKNHAALTNDITELDRSIQRTFEAVDQRTFMVFHPAWGYFAHQYDLQQLAVQIGGQDPSVRELAALVDIAREEDVKVIFIQPNFSAANARALAQEIGGEVVVADPLAREWLENLESVATAFAAALTQ